MNAQNSVKTLILESIAATILIVLPRMIYAADVVDPPAPCHPNPNKTTDGDTVKNRGDVANLPDPLKNRLIALAQRPHTILPLQAYAEADDPSQLFQYYLLDTTGFEPNVFTSQIAGVNDQAMLTVTGADCGLTVPASGPNQFPTIGAVRLVVEPKPGLPTDPNNVRAFIDIFTDIDPLFVINNESGWYEGWMIHDLRVAPMAPPRPDGHAQFGTITENDAKILAKMGSGNNVPSATYEQGPTFTMDGKAPHLPSESDHFPDVQTNVVPIQLSMGAYNAFQQSDAHNYWEFNYQTNWIHPLYELPFTGGFPDQIGAPPMLLKTEKSANFNRLSQAQDPEASKTNRKNMAMILIFPVTLISLTRRRIHSGSFASGSFLVAWLGRSSWMSTSGGLRLNPM